MTTKFRIDLKKLSEQADAMVAKAIQKEIPTIGLGSTMSSGIGMPLTQTPKLDKKMALKNLLKQAANNILDQKGEEAANRFLKALFSRTKKIIMHVVDNKTKDTINKRIDKESGLPAKLATALYYLNKIEEGEHKKKYIKDNKFYFKVEIENDLNKGSDLESICDFIKIYSKPNKKTKSENLNVITQTKAKKASESEINHEEQKLANNDNAVPQPQKVNKISQADAGGTTTNTSEKKSSNPTTALKKAANTNETESKEDNNSDNNNDNEDTFEPTNNTDQAVAKNENEEPDVINNIGLVNLSRLTVSSEYTETDRDETRQILTQNTHNIQTESSQTPDSTDISLINGNDDGTPSPLVASPDSSIDNQNPTVENIHDTPNNKNPIKTEKIYKVFKYIFFCLSALGSILVIGLSPLFVKPYIGFSRILTNKAIGLLGLLAKSFKWQKMYSSLASSTVGKAILLNCLAGLAMTATLTLIVGVIVKCVKASKEKSLSCSFLSCSKPRTAQQMNENITDTSIAQKENGTNNQKVEPALTSGNAPAQTI